MRSRWGNGWRATACALLATAAGTLAGPGSAQAIVGGRVANATDNPSMVGLTERGASASDVLFCGGSLIAPTVVVTAMHCLGYFDNPNGDLARRIDVVGGALNRSSPALQRAQVAQLVRHPSWDDNRTQHDVLVLKLATPLDLPALPLAGPADAALSQPGATLRATGWGLTDYRDDTSQPDALKEADIPVAPDASCSSDFGSAIFAPAFEFCGSSPDGQPDTCQGDSGGPLVGGLPGAEKLVGVVSYGPASCGVRGNSAVYADVAAERDWILAAAGLPNDAPSAAPPVKAPPKARSTVRTRLGTISCGRSTCSVTIRLTGKGFGTAKDVLLRVVRTGQSGLPPAKRFVRATKLRPGLYRARTLLPYGRLALTAVAYDATGAQLGPAARETIRVG